MKANKSHFRSALLVLSSFYCIAAFAAEPAININQSKDNGSTASSDNAPVIEVQPQAAVSEQQTEAADTFSAAQINRKEMDERRAQVRQAQQEAYKRHIERRKQYLASRPGAPVYDRQEINNNVPAYIQERRDQFIKQMEQRRSMNVKMMEQSRKDAEERKATKLKMHQTETPETVKKM